MDVTGQKRGKTKVYDQTALMMEDQNDINETMVTEEITEEEFVEALIADGEDSDAALIADFESTAQDLLQDDPDLSLAFTAYTDARKRFVREVSEPRFFFQHQGQQHRTCREKARVLVVGFRKKGARASVASDRCKIAF